MRKFFLKKIDFFFLFPKNIIRSTLNMEKLKLYSIKNNFLSEKFTNWDALFFETKQTVRNYLVNASEWHKLII
jgi:hypothetical protein